MAVTKVGKRHFSGLGRVATAEAHSLGDVIRKLAQDLARTKLQNTALTDFTDSSTGVAAGTFVDAVIPTAAFDATSAGGALRTDFNTAQTALLNAQAVVGDWINRVRRLIGLPLLSWATGTITTPGTIPALTLTTTTTSGATSLDFASGVTAMKLMHKNNRILVDAWREFQMATGSIVFASTLLKQSDVYGQAIVDTPAAAASATGASAISKAVADAFLTALAANIATIANDYNFFISGVAALVDLTDSSGGTAAATLPANTVPIAAAGAATTSSPKAGFDTELVVIKNSLASLCKRMNELRTMFGLARYTDSTTGTASTTLAADTVNLTAVDGSSGTVAVDQVTGRARLSTIQNACSSLNVGINEVRSAAGLFPFTDSTVGAVLSTTLGAIAATGGGVGGATAVTLLDTDVDAWLVINRNNMATLAKALNDITGTAMDMTPPLQVVASLY